ncbi:MAG: hypothetical protein HYZ03_03215 [candidate division NC10 bacterium]|nr:hypothetical protein [candidate division NC10 bacterium]
MILQTLPNRQRCHAGVRLALVLFALTLALAPAVDRATDADTLNATGDSAKSLDLCTVPGLVLTAVAPRPAELETRLTDVPTLRFPSPLARATDHPPGPT